jgi:Homeodomain
MPHAEDESSYRNPRRTSVTGPDSPTFRRQNAPKPSRSSLLSLTAPRPATRNILSEARPSICYTSPRATGENVVMAPASSSSGSYPTSIPSSSIASIRRDSHGDPKHAQILDYSPSHYYYTSPGQEGVTGSFESSENEASRLKPGETAGGKKRRSRATQEQLDMLNGVYQRTPFPTTAERNELAHQLGMTPRSVQIW